MSLPAVIFLDLELLLVAGEVVLVVGGGVPVDVGISVTGPERWLVPDP